MRKTLTNPAPDADIAHTAAWRDADLGAVNGHGNARSLARMLSPVSLGGAANGVQLLSAQTIDRIFDVQVDGPDLVLGCAAEVRHRLRPADPGGAALRATRTRGSASGAVGVARWC